MTKEFTPDPKKAEKVRRLLEASSKSIGAVAELIHEGCDVGNTDLNGATACGAGYLMQGIQTQLEQVNAILEEQKFYPEPHAVGRKS